jgi:hypothetical protein
MNSLNHIPISGNLWPFLDHLPWKHEYENKHKLESSEGQKIDVFAMEACRRACVIIN